MSKGVTSDVLGICLLGYGYWGMNLMRVITESVVDSKVYLFDSDEDRVSSALRGHPGVIAMSTFDDVLLSDQISAVVCATPSSTHYELVHQLLLSGKHVLVEKPFTLDSHQAEGLTQLAKHLGLVLMVDHIFLYNPAVQKLKSLMQPDFMGRISYIDATRINLGIYQQDVNVLWDLACHDLSIVLHLIDERPQSVMAVGRIHPTYEKEDVAYLFLRYSSGLLVQINSSWASPVKMRKMIIGGEKRMLIYDDIHPTNKLTIYDYSSVPRVDENKSGLADYRLGDIVIPKHGMSEPLRNVVDEFMECVNLEREPLSNGARATEVVRILESAQLSMKENSVRIPL